MNWKKRIVFGREAGKIWNVSKYFSFSVSYSCLTNKDVGFPYTCYLNDHFLGRFKSEEEAMECAEKEFLKIKKEFQSENYGN